MVGWMGRGCRGAAASILVGAAAAGCTPANPGATARAAVTVTAPPVTVTADPRMTVTAPAVTVTASGRPAAAERPPVPGTPAPKRPGASASVGSTPVPPTATGAALTALRSLSVKGRAPKTGYDRVQFGQAWTDDVTVQGGHNGCDTRNDALRRDLLNVTLKPDSNGCSVLSGTLTDPYSGEQVQFIRGPQSSAVPIDHVIALSNAWQTGAQQLDSQQRRDFANDPLNLIATRRDLNSQKGDGDAATWLPPSKAYRCAYVARQVAVKARYRLWVTPPEEDAIRRVLSSCPDQGLPTTADTATPAP